MQSRGSAPKPIKSHIIWLHHSNGTNRSCKNSKYKERENEGFRFWEGGGGGAAVKDPPVEERECRGGWWIQPPTFGRSVGPTVSPAPGYVEFAPQQEAGEAGTNYWSPSFGRWLNKRRWIGHWFLRRSLQWPAGDRPFLWIWAVRSCYNMLLTKPRPPSEFLGDIKKHFICLRPCAHAQWHTITSLLPKRKTTLVSLLLLECDSIGIT
jgi:hypothetical protein